LLDTLAIASSYDLVLLGVSHSPELHTSAADLTNFKLSFRFKAYRWNLKVPSKHKYFLPSVHKIV
jgi:hypothetical protein